MNILIIEAAGKKEKISKILGNDFKIIPTIGHIRELKNSDYDSTGISKELDYDWQFINGRKKIMDHINIEGKNADNIYLAADPDREGEGIAWHVFDCLNKSNQSKCKRITFNSVSENAIRKALSSPRKINMNEVDAYFSRCGLDKKIGFGLARCTQKIVNGKSAGRVQSATLKLIYEREQEFKSFIKRKYWKIIPIIKDANLEQIDSLTDFEINKNFEFDSFENINKYIIKNLNHSSSSELSNFIVVGKTEPVITKKYPSKPFETSSLQKKAIKKLNICAEEVTKLLNLLYFDGFITYPRSDSTKMDLDFCNESFNYIKLLDPILASNEFNFNNIKTKKGEQGAHECIRVSHLELTPEKFNQLNNEKFKLVDRKVLNELYKIIYQQTFIQFLKPAIIEETKVVFDSNKKNRFIAKSSKVINEGFTKYTKLLESKIVNFEIGEMFSIENKLLICEKETKPPSLFNESSLIDELKRLGIGRPSTYSSAVSINQKRGYTKITSENKEIAVTDLGKSVIEYLNNDWNDIVNFQYTSSMEESLDDISLGVLNWKTYLKDIFNSFEAKLSLISFNNPTLPLDRYGSCPICNSATNFKDVPNKNGGIEFCSNSKYDFKTKKKSGCVFSKWHQNGDK